MRIIISIIFVVMLVACGEDTVPVETENINDENVDMNGIPDPDKQYIENDSAVPDKNLDEMTTDSDIVDTGYTMVDVAYTDLLNQGMDGAPLENKRYEIFRDKTAFEEFFALVNTGGAEAPVVDFDTNMVIALFNGMWPDLRPIYLLDGIKKLVFNDPENIHYKVLLVETTTHYYSDKLDADQMFYYPLRLISVEKAEFVNFVDHFVIETSY